VSTSLSLTTTILGWGVTKLNERVFVSLFIVSVCKLFCQTVRVIIFLIKCVNDCVRYVYRYQKHFNHMYNDDETIYYFEMSPFTIVIAYMYLNYNVKVSY